MRVWKWLIILIVLALDTNAGVFHTEVETPDRGALFGRIVRTGVDNGIEGNRKAKRLAENVFPLDLQIEPDFVSVLERGEFDFFPPLFEVRGKIVIETKPYLIFDRPAGTDGLASGGSFLRVGPRQDSRQAWSTTNRMNVGGADNGDIASRRLTRVSELESGRQTTFVDAISRGSTKKVSADLGLSNLSRHIYCILGSLSGAFGLNNGFASVTCSVTRIDQRTPDQIHANASQQDAKSGSDKHPESPNRHTLLGAQISVIAVALLFAGYLVSLGYQLADRGFDTLDAGQKLRGAAIFWGGLLGAWGSAAAILAGGFWFALQGGLRTLLGV